MKPNVILNVDAKDINFLNNWASEASPTLGCSIEISRDIYTRKMVPITRRASFPNKKNVVFSY